MAKQFTLGKSERLKSRKQIEKLFSDGKSFAVFPYKVFYNTTNDQQPTASALQFGTGVSARNFKKAVDRNKIKRLTREAYRLQKKALYQLLIEKKLLLNVFFVYTGKELPEYKLVFEKVKIALQKLSKGIV
jgi:ribonuclease P protein component